LRETVRLLSSTKLQSVEAKQRNHRNGETMNTRQLAIFGLAALGLALAAPVQAAPDSMEASFVVAKNDRNDNFRDDRRDDRKDDRRNLKRDDDDRDAYGYGYERRKQKHDDDDDDRNRSRDRR